MKKIVVASLLIVPFLAMSELLQSCNRASPVSAQTNPDTIHINPDSIHVNPGSTHTNPDTIDVFPLDPGAHFTYSYADTSYSAEESGFVESEVVDSGTIEYTVQDSLRVSATSRVWFIREQDAFLRRHYAPSAPYEMALDTSYWVNTNRVDTLVESLVGAHELRCSSTIWHFPFADSASNEIPPSTDSICLRAFRYGSSPYKILSGTYNPYGDGSLYDRASLSFEAGAGLTYFSEYHSEGLYTYRYRKLYAELINGG